MSASAARRTRHLDLVKRDHEVSRCLRSTQGPCPAWQGDSFCEEVIEVHAEGPKVSGGKRAVFRSWVPVDRATELPQRRILVSGLLKLTSQIGRELAHAAEVVGPELGEDPVAVYHRGPVRPGALPVPVVPPDERPC